MTLAGISQTQNVERIQCGRCFSTLRTYALPVRLAAGDVISAVQTESLLIIIFVTNACCMYRMPPRQLTPGTLVRLEV